MSYLLVVGISVSVLLCIGMIADRILANKVAWQDLAWRMTLLAVLILPLFSVLAGTNWPAGLIRIPVLAAEPELASIDWKPEKDFRSSNGYDGNNERSLAGSPRKKQPIQSSSNATESNQPKPLVGSIAASQFPSINGTGKKVDSREKTSASSMSIGFGFSWLGLAKTIWLLGSLCFLVRYIAGWWTIRMVVAGATSANKTEPRGWSDAIDRATFVARLNSRIVVRASDKISTPMLVGVTRPLVLVPAAMLQLSPSDARVQAALSHEAMHIRRADARWSLMLFVCLLIWWPIPMVHWMKTRMFWLRELLCDADVAVEMGAADYAESLLKLTQLPNQLRIGLLAVPMHSQKQSLESRIAWILEMSTSVPNPSRSTRHVIWSSLIVALLGFTTIKLVPASSPSPPSVAISPRIGDS